MSKKSLAVMAWWDGWRTLEIRQPALGAIYWSNALAGSIDSWRQFHLVRLVASGLAGLLAKHCAVHRFYGLRQHRGHCSTGLAGPDWYVVRLHQPGTHDFPLSGGAAGAVCETADADCVPQPYNEAIAMADVILVLFLFLFSRADENTIKFGMSSS